MKKFASTDTLKEILFKVSKPVRDRVLDLKNRHKGESCYIFGDGMSIKWFDLSAFPKKTAFSLSYLPYHTQSGVLDLRYSLMTEPKYFYPYFRQPWPPRKLWRNRIQEKYRRVIVEHPDTIFFVNLSNYPVIRGGNICFLFRSIEDDAFEFIRECRDRGLGIYEGSFRCAIALAIYMGFADIMLVGCDYTHDISRSLHWYEKGEGTLLPQPDYQRDYLEVARKYARIMTITMEGGGSVLPSMTYTELTGKQLAFRENHALLDPETKKFLATWPGYAVY
jgi:hypothetical protein